MLKRKRFYERPGFWRWGLLITLIGLYCVFFWNDVVNVFIRSLWYTLMGLPVYPPEGWVNPFELLPQAIQNVIKFLIVFGGFLPVVILFSSQFILPVRTLDERLMVFDRLWRYAMNSHGPAIFVREGKQIATAEEVKRPYPGLVFVDMNSAIVLQRISKPRPPSKATRSLMDTLRGRPGTYRLTPVARAEGPGIVFMGAKERILDIADLRKQFRVNNGGGEGVRAYTKDGIEVSSAVVITIFSLGQLPEVLDVAYVGEEIADNLRVITTDKRIVEDPNSPSRWRQEKYIKSISKPDDTQDLDDEDKREIHRFAQDRKFLEGLLESFEREAQRGYSSIDEESLLAFVRSLGIKDPGPVERFINNLFLNNQLPYRRFITRLKPVDTETIHRFVLNKDALYQLADSVAEKDDASRVKSFIDQLYDTYRNEVLEFYEMRDEEPKKIIRELFQRFHTTQQIPAGYRPARKIGSSPFYFDERRIFAALYAKAQRTGEGAKEDDWRQLPPSIATEYYRSILSRYKYDELFSLESDAPPLFLTEVKPKLSRAVRYQGVLAYHFIRRRDGETPQVGDIIDDKTYVLDHPSLELRTPKVLRDRGIKVIAASFSELRVDPAISRQRLDNWLANWQSEVERTTTQNEIEIMQIRSRARAQAQRELIQDLSSIFSQPYTKEAMAVRIFQTLETAAADPETRRLLPRDTLDFIQNLRSWLMRDNLWRNQPFGPISPNFRRQASDPDSDKADERPDES